MKENKRIFALSKSQTEYLMPLFDEIKKMDLENNTGMLIAQIHLGINGSAFVQAGIIDEEKSIKIQKVMNSEGIKTENIIFTCFVPEDIE
jgi:hypothetical protein